MTLSYHQSLKLKEKLLLKSFCSRDQREKALFNSKTFLLVEFLDQSITSAAKQNGALSYINFDMKTKNASK